MALLGQAITASGSFTIPATQLKLTVLGGGGGAAGPSGADPGHGGSGSMLIKWLAGLTPGNTLTIVIGAHGAGGVGSAAGSDGTSSVVSSGTETIATLTAHGGGGGSDGTGGTKGALATGGDINSIGNGGGSGGSGGQLPSGFGNYGWGGQENHDLYGNGVGAAADGLVVAEWCDEY